MAGGCVGGWGWMGMGRWWRGGIDYGDCAGSG